MAHRSVKARCLLLASSLALLACAPADRGGDDEAVAASRSASPAATAVIPRDRLQAELPVTGEPDWLVVAYGSVWVARDEAAAVDRISPESNEVLASTPMGGHPCNGAAGGFDAIWVPSCSEQALYRIGAQTGKVEARIPLPVYQSLKGVAPSGGLATGHGAVWIITQGEGGRYDALAQVDPGRNVVVRTIPLGHVGGRVAVDASSIWVTSPAEGLLLRVDPGSGQVKKIGGLVQPTALTVALGAVWVLSGRWVDRPHGDGSVTRVDPVTNAITARIRVEEVTGTPGALTTGGGFLWARTSATALAKIDPAANTLVERYRNDRGNGDLVFGFDSLWMSDFVFNAVRRVAL